MWSNSCEKSSLKNNGVSVVANIWESIIIRFSDFTETKWEKILYYESDNREKGIEY